MSHLITNIDRQEGIEQAWHGLTVIRKVIELAKNWLTEWDVEKRPMQEPEGTPSEYCRIVCTDDPQIKIGKPVHCDSYGLITNADFLRVVANALKEIPGATVCTVGSVAARSKIFLSVKLAELAEYNAAGRTFVPFLNFLSSHDMSAPFAVVASTFCTVCANTFGANLAVLKDNQAKGVRIRFNHTKNVADRLANVPEIVSGFHGSQLIFRTQMETLALQKITVDDSQAIFAGLLTPEDKATVEMSTRRFNQVERLVELFRFGAGNSGENRADAFSAVTDYFTHENAGGLEDSQRQFFSSEFGGGHDMKRTAMSVLSDEKEFAKALERGRNVLALN